MRNVKKKSKSQKREYAKKYRENNKEKRKKYREKNKERIRDNHRKYYKKNKKKIMDLHKKWCNKNKKHIKKYSKKYHEKQNQIPEFRENRRIRDKKYYQENKEKIKERINNYRKNPAAKKRIKKWREDNKEHIKEHRENNKEYRKRWNKEYYKKNKDKKREYSKKHKERRKDWQKKYQEKNREELRIKKKIWNEKHKEETKKNFAKGGKYYEKRKEYNRKHIKNRLKTDIQFNIKMRLRNCFNNALKKYVETERFIVSKNKNIDYKAIIEHLKPFPEDIKNWHIDHIIPVSFFDLTNEEHLKKAWSPINFQWLKVSDNISKKDIIDFKKYPEQEKVYKKLNLSGSSIL